eukprot:gb/GECG01012233.1/.p1 GENE.gb/GECG01012233.1/~~gb/GECG01012233.1/.p1  ORF type:complete len:1675 (+),score=220.59 gb/GECG01012233.1/:1-5025(+)
MSVLQCAQTIAESLALQAPQHGLQLDEAVELLSQDTVSSSTATERQQEDEGRSYVRALTTGVIEQPHDLYKQDYWRGLLAQEPQRRHLMLALALREDIQVRIREPERGNTEEGQDASWETVAALIQSEESFETLLCRMVFLPSEGAVAVERGTSLPDAKIGTTSLEMLSLVAQAGPKGVSAKALMEKMGIDSKAVFYHMLPLLERGLVNKNTEMQGRLNRFTLFRYNHTDNVNNTTKAVSQLVDILREVSGNAIRVSEALEMLALNRTEKSKIREYVSSTQDATCPIETVRLRELSSATAVGDEEADNDDHAEGALVNCFRLKPNAREAGTASSEQIDIGPNSLASSDILKRQLLPSTQPSGQGSLSSAASKRRKIGQVNFTQEAIERITLAGPDGIRSSELQRQLRVGGKLFYRILLDLRKRSSVTSVPISVGKLNEQCLFLSSEMAMAKKNGTGYHPSTADSRLIEYLRENSSVSDQYSTTRDSRVVVLTENKKKNLRALIEYTVRRWKVVHRHFLGSVARAYDESAYSTTIDRTTLLNTLRPMAAEGKLLLHEGTIYHQASNKPLKIPVVADPSASEEEVDEFLRGNEECQRIHPRWYRGSVKLFKLLGRGKLPSVDHEEEVSSDSEDDQPNDRATKIPEEGKVASVGASRSFSVTDTVTGRGEQTSSVAHETTTALVSDSSQKSVVTNGDHLQGEQLARLTESRIPLRLQSLQKPAVSSRISGHTTERILAPLVKCRGGKVLRAAALHCSIIRYLLSKAKRYRLPLDRSTSFDLNDFLLHFRVVDYIHIVGIAPGRGNFASLAEDINDSMCLKDLSEDTQRSLIERGNQVSKLQTVVTVLTSLGILQKSHEQIDLGAHHKFAEVIYKIHSTLWFPSKQSGSKYTLRRLGKNPHNVEDVVLDISNEAGVIQFWRDVYIIANSIRTNSKISKAFSNDDGSGDQDSFQCMYLHGEDKNRQNPILGFPSQQRFKKHQEDDVLKLYFMNVQRFIDVVVRKLFVRMKDFMAKSAWISPCSATREGNEKRQSQLHEGQTYRKLKELAEIFDKYVVDKLVVDTSVPELTSAFGNTQVEEDAPSKEAVKSELKKSKEDFSISGSIVQGRGSRYKIKGEAMPSNVPVAGSNFIERTAVDWSAKEDSLLLRTIMGTVNKWRNNPSPGIPTEIDFEVVEEAVLTLFGVQTESVSTIRQLLKFLDPYWTYIAHNLWELESTCRHRFVYLMASSDELLAEMVEHLEHSGFTSAAIPTSETVQNHSGHSRLCPLQNHHLVQCLRWMFHNEKSVLSLNSKPAGEIPPELYSPMDKLLWCQTIKDTKPNKAMSIRGKRGEVTIGKRFQSMFRDSLLWLHKQIKGDVHLTDGTQLLRTFKLSAASEDTVQDSLPAIVERFAQDTNCCRPLPSNQPHTASQADDGSDRALTLTQLLDRIQQESSFDVHLEFEEKPGSSSEVPQEEHRRYSEDNETAPGTVKGRCPHGVMDLEDSMKLASRDVGTDTLLNWNRNGTGFLVAGATSVGIQRESESSSSVSERELVDTLLHPSARRLSGSELCSFPSTHIANSLSLVLLSWIWRYPGISVEKLVEGVGLLSRFDVHMLLYDLFQWNLIRATPVSVVNSVAASLRRIEPLPSLLLYEHCALFPSAHVKEALDASPFVTSYKQIAEELSDDKHPPNQSAQSSAA